MFLYTFLYMGPGQLLPLASAVAAAIGAVLLFGRYFLSLIRRVVGLSPKQSASEMSADEASAVPAQTRSAGLKVKK